MKRWLILFVLLGLLGIGIYVNRSAREVTMEKTQPVSDFDYYPAKTPKNVLAVLLHGGSWMGGDKEQLSFVGTYLADRGASVINMNYRLAPTHTYDAPLADVAAVIKQVEAEKEKYGLADDYRLFLLGFSAGGHLASQFCLTEDTYGIKQADGCISLAGIYDLDRIAKGQDGSLLTEPVEDFLGTTQPKDASPIFQIKPDESTKFLLMAGADDTVISPAQMSTFTKKLDENKAYVESITVPNKDHLGIFSTIPMDDAVGWQILEFMGLPHLEGTN